MITTTVTSANFKKFSKSLSKNTKNQDKPIPLLTAQEALAKTFGYSNHHEFIQVSKKDNFNPIVLGKNNFEHFVERFKSVLISMDFNYTDNSYLNIFQSTFGLEQDRKLSATDIIIELNNMKKNGTVKLEKVFFVIVPDLEGKMRLQFYFKNKFIEQNLNNKKDKVDKNEISKFLTSLYEKYKNLGRAITAFDKAIKNYNYGYDDYLENLYYSIKDISEDENTQLRFIGLIDQLYDFSDEHIMASLNKNRKHFMVQHGSLFVISCTLHENHIVIEQDIKEQKFIVINKKYLDFIRSRESIEGYKKINIGEIPEFFKYSFDIFELAVDKMNDLCNHIILDSYRNRFSYKEKGSYLLVKEYFENTENEIEKHLIK